MNRNNTSNKGALMVSEDVIITITKQAALDVKGVACLKSDKGLLLTKSSAISVTQMGDVISIRVIIIVKDGEKAAIVAQNVQNAVKENIQTMTGITVAKVNVVVDGIEF